MASKTKLELAVEKQAKNLDPAQRELVLTQLSTYKWNVQNISRVQDKVTAGGDKLDDQARKSYMNERHQCVAENVSISSKLFMLLKGTGDTTDEFDRFMAGSEE